MPKTGETLTLRGPYPLGFHSRHTSGRIDDEKAGWKGRGFWSSYSMYTPWHQEGGKAQRPKIVKFQVRPDPLAKIAGVVRKNSVRTACSWRNLDPLRRWKRAPNRPPNQCAWEDTPASPAMTLIVDETQSAQRIFSTIDHLDQETSRRVPPWASKCNRARN